MKSERSCNENVYSNFNLKTNDAGQTISRRELKNKILRNNIKDLDSNLEEKIKKYQVRRAMNPNNFFFKNNDHVNRNRNESNESKERIKLRLTLPKQIKNKKGKSHKK